MGTKKKQGNGKGRYTPPASQQGNPRPQKTSQYQQQHYKKSSTSPAGVGKCPWCGHEKHPKEQCPARDAMCMKCRKKGHYARVCMAGKSPYRQVKDLNTESTPYDLPSTSFGTLVATKMGSIRSAQVKSLKAMRPIWISGEDQKEQLHELQCEIDTGAGCDVMPWQIYKDVFGRKPLDKATMTITGYGGNSISNLGSSMMKIHLRNRKMSIRFQIMETAGPPILGLQSARLLGYVDFPKVEKPAKKLEGKEIKVHTAVHSLKSALDEKPRGPGEVQKPQLEQLDDHTVKIDGTIFELPLTKEVVLKKFKDVFTGIGELPGEEYTIKLRADAVPVQHTPRHCPEKKKEAYQAELRRMEKLGIIQKVEEHTKWVNSVVPACKSNGDIRICLDPKDLNDALERNPYYNKTVDEVQAELGDAEAAFFTLVDVRSGYWIIKLDEASSTLTTFNTPWGKWKFLRLPFGLKISSDVFQQRLDNVFRSLQGVTGIADDCLAYGKDICTHDIALLKLLSAARMNGVKFNPAKMQFRTQECHFFGEVLTKDGMKADQKKIEAVRTMAPPEDKQTLSSFLGLVNYMKRYNGTLSEVSKPLRELLK
jgi:hypothetical protein